MPRIFFTYKNFAHVKNFVSYKNFFPRKKFFHVKNLFSCKILLHVIDCSQNNFIESYKKIRNEIIKYGKKLEEKSEIIGISKSDLNKQDIIELQKNIKIQTGKIPFIFSSHTKSGINNLINELFNQCKK